MEIPIGASTSAVLPRLNSIQVLNQEAVSNLTSSQIKLKTYNNDITLQKDVITCL